MVIMVIYTHQMMLSYSFTSLIAISNCTLCSKISAFNIVTNVWVTTVGAHVLFIVSSSRIFHTSLCYSIFALYRVFQESTFLYASVPKLFEENTSKMRKIFWYNNPLGP
jgi:hypothetical protein